MSVVKKPCSAFLQVKAVNIQGSLSSKDLNFAIDGSDVKVIHDGEMSLHRLAARAQINQWQVDQEGNQALDRATRQKL